MTDRKASKASIETLFRSGMSAGHISAKLRIPIDEVRECITKILHDPTTYLDLPNPEPAAVPGIPAEAPAEAPTETTPAAPITEQSGVDNVDRDETKWMDRAPRHRVRAVTDRQKQQIAELRANGMTVGDIAVKLGLGLSTVGRYVSQLTKEQGNSPVLQVDPEGRETPIIDLRDCDPAATPDHDSPVAVLTCQSVTISELREEWTLVHRHDQERAAMAARMLRVLDNLSEEFKDDPEMANTVASQGVAALTEAYSRMKDTQDRLREVAS